MTWINAEYELPPVEREVLVKVKRSFRMYANGEWIDKEYDFCCVGVYEDGEVKKCFSDYQWEDKDDSFIPEGWWEVHHYGKYYADDLVKMEDTYDNVKTEVTHWTIF